MRKALNHQHPNVHRLTKVRGWLDPVWPTIQFSILSISAVTEKAVLIQVSGEDIEDLPDKLVIWFPLSQVVVVDAKEKVAVVGMMMAQKKVQEIREKYKQKRNWK